jgi:hypothetical protein
MNLDILPDINIVSYDLYAPFNFTGIKILEYHAKYARALSSCYSWQTDIFSETYVSKAIDTDSSCPFWRKDDRICRKYEELNTGYDMLIINESLEFSEDPTNLLLNLKSYLKPHGKIFIRFKPWTSINGGYQKSYCNKAYAHLLADLERNKDIKFRPLRPLAAYEQMFKELGLLVASKNLSSVPPSEIITQNEEIMNTIISNTWGHDNIDKATAVSIMSTTSVYYLLLT